jgi:RNA polymerase Rpb3/Rpb11 dimerisation domain
VGSVELNSCYGFKIIVAQSRLQAELNECYFLISSVSVKIESAAALPPEVLFTEAVKILEEKCERVISELS